MKFPWTKPPKVLDTWEYAPYAFEPGRIYVLEFNRYEITMETLRQLDDYFKRLGVNVKLVPNAGQRVLQPLEVARMTKEEE